MTLNVWMIYFQSVQVKIELGHLASKRDNPSPEGYTHNWTVYVRGPDNSNISHFVEKVVFKLHQSFHKPKRGKIFTVQLVCNIHCTCTCMHTHLGLKYNVHEGCYTDVSLIRNTMYTCRCLCSKRTRNYVCTIYMFM